MTNFNHSTSSSADHDIFQFRREEHSSKRLILLQNTVSDLECIRDIALVTNNAQKI